MPTLIIGGGLAGVTVALSLAPAPVTLIMPENFGENCASAWAQGGIAAAMGTDDSATLHAADTLKAGAGLCDPAIVQRVTADGADVIARLIAAHVPFDRDDSGALRLGLEAAHSRRRIVHAAGAATGHAIMQALVAAVRATSSITVLDHTTATDLIADDDGITGVKVERHGTESILPATNVVLATGGVGALWQHTTNPLGSWGHGLALAARAGAALGDLEFMQFHPTAIDIGHDPMPLASEALRGEGAMLIDETGDRFTDEMQPRDIVTRAIWQHMGNNHRVFLDTRQAIGDSFGLRFPSIHAVCVAAGIDPSRQPIPVRPAAHYHMGGIVTDDHGRTTVPGLWACGEVACTGLHGANRLASNSLLEAASFGKRVAEGIASSLPLAGRVREGDVRLGAMVPNRQQAFQRIPPPPNLPRKGGGTDSSLRHLLSAHLGVLRDAAGLRTVLDTLSPLAATSDQALVGMMIAAFALQRTESRGAHTRTDYPETTPAWERRQVMTLGEIWANDTGKLLSTGV